MVGPWVARWIHGSHLAIGRPYFSSTVWNHRGWWTWCISGLPNLISRFLNLPKCHNYMVFFPFLSIIYEAKGKLMFHSFDSKIFSQSSSLNLQFQEFLICICGIGDFHVACKLWCNKANLRDLIQSRHGMLDGWTDRVKPIIHTTTSLCGGIIK